MLTTADRLDILDVVTRADNAATRRDADAYVAFFADDALLEGDMGEHHGRDQLRQAVGPIWESEGSSSMHCTLNAVVEDVPGDPVRAIVTSLLVILKGAPSFSVEGVSFITQYLIKVNSHWIVQRRSVRSRVD
jgi:ketosteroid isomerase-like protein